MSDRSTAYRSRPTAVAVQLAPNASASPGTFGLPQTDCPTAAARDLAIFEAPQRWKKPGGSLAQQRSGPAKAVPTHRWMLELRASGLAMRSIHSETVPHTSSPVWV